jgi:hypothetical protein
MRTCCVDACWLGTQFQMIGFPRYPVVGIVEDATLG